MPKKDSYQIIKRNDAIRQTFYHYLHTGLSHMMAYARTAEEYYLCIDRVRDIVAHRRLWLFCVSYTVFCIDKTYTDSKKASKLIQPALGNPSNPD